MGIPGGKYMDKFGPGWYREYGIGPGWLDIVDGALDKIFEIDPGAELHQIKEKFAGLRIYLATTEDLPRDKFDQIYTLIGEAEAQAEKTCEECGKEGKVTNIGYWMVTLCDEDKRIKTEQRIKLEQELTDD